MNAEATVQDAVVSAKAGSHSDATSRRHSRESGNPVSFARYPKYKNSGVAWLSEVPAHWEVKPVKAVASCNDDVLAESTDATDEIVYVEISGVSSDQGITETQTLAFGTAPSRARRRVQDGDVLVSTVRTYLRAIAPLSDPPENMIASTGFAVIRPRSINSAFLGYTFRSEFLIAEIISRSVGVSYPAINASDLMRLLIPVPREDEQTAIVAFLDRETAKIDALITEQGKLIALLKEKRQALISHAVTKGLDPNAPMKDSGIEWLGQVPTHWDLTPLQRLTDPTRPIMYGIVLPGPDVEKGIPILKGGNVKPSKLNLESMARTTPEIESPYARARLKSGDLVYAIRGSIGDCEMVPPELEDSNITQDVARIAIQVGVCAHWARWALLASAIREELGSGSLGAAVRGVNIFSLRRVKIPTPPREEQLAITEFLNVEISKLASLVEEALGSIVLLKERRAALISAAVTGKIDVRGETAKVVA